MYQAAHVAERGQQEITYLCFSSSLCEDLFRETQRQSSLHCPPPEHRMRALLRGPGTCRQCGGGLRPRMAQDRQRWGR